LVVQEILHSLGPVTTELEHPREPLVRELRHLVHLQTPIRGRLNAPLHILRLAERLHPTPAVGGVPTAQAVGWIREHEPHDRGWYAGPIGWFDTSGDGELWVSLRSGVIEGSTAYLYAGGGIVRDSDPEREYDETRLKLASLSSALRVAP
jgi:isochorismate synthase EntC